jgi:O-antigen/teichoic acid export membrane protein
MSGTDLSASIVHFLNITAADFVDINNSFKLLALTIPIFLLNQLWIAILEGDEKFKAVNIQKSFSTFIAGMPALFVIFDGTLLSAIAGLLISRIISLLIAFLLVRNEIVQSGMRLDLVTFKRLIFLAAGSRSVTLSVQRWSILIVLSFQICWAPGILLTTLDLRKPLPVGDLACRSRQGNLPQNCCAGHKDELKRNMTVSWLLMFAVCAPVVIIGIVFAENILHLWLGTSYAAHSKNILIILLVGFLFNALAQVPLRQSSLQVKLKLLLCSTVLRLYPTL